MGNYTSAVPELAKALKKLAPALSEVAEAVRTLATAAEVQTALNQAKLSTNPQIITKASKSAHNAISVEDDATARTTKENPVEGDLKPSEEDRKVAPTNIDDTGSTEPRVLPPLSEVCATPLPHRASTVAESPVESQADKGGEGLNEAAKSKPASDAEVAAARAKRMSDCTKLYKQLVYLGWDEKEARVEARRFIADICKKIGAPVTNAGDLPHEFHNEFMEGLNSKLYEVRK